MTSLRQIEANRRNAEHSSGPRTDEGKRRSRRNALKHGMAGRGVVLPEEFAAEVQRRMEDWNSSIKPCDGFEMYLFEQLCIESVRIDAANYDLVELKRRRAERARTHWDDDRRIEAEGLALRLADEPTVVARSLRRTVQGVALVIGRWEVLMAILEAGGDWDAEQRRLAFDLLGTPSEFRSGPTRLGPSADRPDRDACLAVARGEVAGLRDRLVGDLETDDAIERLTAEVGVGQAVSPPEAQARRYLGGCRRRLEWARAELRRRGAPGRASAPARPVSAAAAMATATPPTPVARPQSAAPAEESVSARFLAAYRNVCEEKAARVEAARPVWPPAEAPPPARAAVPTTATPAPVS